MSNDHHHVMPSGSNGGGSVVGRPIRQLTWDDRSHWRVLTQSAGSVWPRVLPYCILNVVLTYGVYYFKSSQKVDNWDLTSSSTGHKYMSMLMAFLVVTRVKITYDNYMQNANNLSLLYESIRGFVQEMCVMTANDKSARAKQWRQDVTYAAIVLLRVTISILEYKSNPHLDPWAMAAEAEMKTEICKKENMINKKHDNNNTSPNVAAQAILKHTNNDDDSHPFVAHGCMVDDATAQNNNDSHEQHQDDQLQSICMLEEVCRVPITLAYNVRCQLLKQRDGTWIDRRAVWMEPPCIEEMRLCDYIGSFIKGYHGLKKLILTPSMPFPLVQMAKTMLFLWLYSLPFALCHDYDSSSSAPIVPLGLIFLITFGFCGSEFVAMELTDPFGDDPSDFDDLGHAQITFEDCYIAIYKLDGDKWAAALRRRVMQA